MPTKRKHDDSLSNENVHESRQFQVYGNNPKPPKKLRRQETSTFDLRKKYSSINTIKKKLRDVNRRLARTDIQSAEIRIQDERARDAYLMELAAAEAEKIRQKMIKKYHMVRFFERQKASRLIKKNRKLLLAAESEPEVEALKKKIHEAEVDLNYALYHPLSETYISLYPRDKATDNESDENSESTNEKPPIWYEIEKAMTQGSLEKIRNRVSVIPIPSPKVNIKEQKMKKSEKTIKEPTVTNRRQRRLEIAEARIRAGVRLNTNLKDENSKHTQNAFAEETEESDGGFFE